MKKLSAIIAVFVAFGAVFLTVRGCAALPAYDASAEKPSLLYINPQPVTIEGYDGSLMEPFISLDGQFLFFNNENSPDVDTDLHFAERMGMLSFRYLGRLPNANGKKLDAAASMDAQGRFYYTAMREYGKVMNSLYTGTFDGKGLADVRPLEGKINPSRLGHVNMDVSISPDGNTLYISRAAFTLFRHMPKKSDILMAEKMPEGFIFVKGGGAILRRINTEALEYAPSITADGRELYFTRASRLMTGGEKGEGAHLRLMIARRASTDEPFGEPMTLSALSGFVEAPTLPHDKSELFYHKRVGRKFMLFRAVRNPVAEKTEAFQPSPTIH